MSELYRFLHDLPFNEDLKFPLSESIKLKIRHAVISELSDRNIGRLQQLFNNTSLKTLGLAQYAVQSSEDKVNSSKGKLFHYDTITLECKTKNPEWYSKINIKA